MLLSLVILNSTIVLLVAILGIFSVLGISYGEGGSGRYEGVSLVVLSIVMLRAGIIEEICYRVYAMERLEKYPGTPVPLHHLARHLRPARSRRAIANDPRRNNAAIKPRSHRNVE